MSAPNVTLAPASGVGSTIRSHGNRAGDHHGANRAEALGCAEPVGSESSSPAITTRKYKERRREHKRRSCLVEDNRRHALGLYKCEAPNLPRHKSISAQ